MVTACWWVLVNGLVAQGLSGLGQAHAQSIYRCGSSYSSDASCGQGKATSVALQGETAHVAKPANDLAQHMQSEADRLEKVRQREESARLKQQAPLAQQAAKTVAQTPASEVRSGHKGKKHKNSKPPSPYFTAKGTAENQKP